MKFRSQTKIEEEIADEDDGNFPKLPSRTILRELASVDFDTEYAILIAILEQKNAKNIIDLSGAAYKAWRLFIRARQDVRIRKDSLNDSELKKRAELVSKRLAGGGKITEATIKTMLDSDPGIRKIKMAVRKAEDVQDICEGLAKALGIEKDFVKYER